MPPNNDVLNDWTEEESVSETSDGNQYFSSHLLATLPLPYSTLVSAMLFY